jgi:hypothetical protein
MEVKLVVASGKNAGQKIAVPGPKFFIGRSEDCQLRPNSELVSRHHCVILVEDAFVAVRDFGSKNGTFVNDQLVRAEQELKNGDRLRIGQLEFTLELAVVVGGKKKPKVHSIQEAAARAAQTSAAPQEVDLASLLGDAADPALASQMETQALAGASSAAVPAGVEQTPSAVAKTDEPAVEVKDESPKKTEPPKKTDAPSRAEAAQAWKGLQEKKPEAHSSRDAAADMLKQMFNRGKH